MDTAMGISDEHVSMGTSVPSVPRQPREAARNPRPIHLRQLPAIIYYFWKALSTRIKDSWTHFCRALKASRKRLYLTWRSRKLSSERRRRKLETDSVQRRGTLKDGSLRGSEDGNEGQRWNSKPPQRKAATKQRSNIGIAEPKKYFHLWRDILLKVKTTFVLLLFLSVLLQINPDRYQSHAILEILLVRRVLCPM